MPAKGFTHETTGATSKEWYTPKRLFDALGLTFDLDVASPGADVVPWIPAARHLTFVDDGLSAPWAGRVWCNPPYGKHTAAWVRRFVTYGCGVALVFARTDVAWFHQWATKADALCFVRGRIQFVRGDGRPAGQASAGSLMLACGDDCVDALQRAALGFFVKR